MPGSIVLATDFSDLAATAYPRAVELANALGRGIRLVHAVEPSGPTPVGLEGPWSIDPPENALRGPLEKLAHVRRLVCELGGCVCAEELVPGPAAGAILAALSQGAVAAVVATHGYTGLRRLIVGSVTRRVIRGAMVPVLVIPPRAKKDPIRRILVATIPREVTDETVTPIRKLAAAWGAGVELFHAFHPDDIAPAPGEWTMDHCCLETAAARRKASITHLERAAERARTQGCTIDVRAVEARRPAAAILERAAEWDADLLVVGTRDLDSLSRWLTGSVADEVIRRAQCPVLVAGRGLEHLLPVHTPDSPRNLCRD